MFQLEFDYQGSPLVIQVITGDVLFNTLVGGVIKRNTIEGVKLLPVNIVKEFPDLKDKPYSEQRTEAIKRFKEKIKSFKTEEEIKEYLIRELIPNGYVLRKSLSGSEMMAYARKHGARI